MVEPTPALQDQVRQQAEGLRAVARLIEQHPELSDVLAFPLRHLSSYLVTEGTDARGTLGAFRRATLAAGADVSVANDPSACTVAARFGPVVVRVRADAALMAGQPAQQVAYVPLDEGALANADER